MWTCLTANLTRHSEATAQILGDKDNNVLPSTSRPNLVSRTARETLERRTQFHHIDVLLSGLPIQMVYRKVPLAAFIHARITGHIARYIVHLPDNTKCLILPASECESSGVRTVVS